MEPEVREEDLPGIGRRYSVPGNDGGVLTIVVHNTGRRDLYLFPGKGRDPVTVSMDDRQAQLAAAVMNGEYAPPAGISEIKQLLGDLAIEWYALGPGSRGTGQSIEQLHISSATGVSVMAILRGHQVIYGPRDSEVLQAEDRLIVAGRRSSMAEFRRLVVDS